MRSINTYMLLGNFYHILESSKDGQTYRVKVAFNAAHEIFKGHFPDLPVVPGVCQTQMLIEVLGQVLNRPIEMRLAHHIKFLALLNPTKESTIDMEIKIDKEEADRIWVSAIYTSPVETYFRFKGELA